MKVSRYLVNKAILPVEGADGSTSIKRRAIQCESCGYVHPLHDEPGPDLCEHCNAQLPPAYDNLFRMQNASTRRRDRINSDEEERFRMGYELKTGVRFARRGGVVSARTAHVVGEDGEALASLVYGHGATIWRMNLGWRRRRNQDQVGYLLDIERGYWAKSQAVDDDPEDPLSPRQERVVPYVEDTRNCIMVQPAGDLTIEQMASLEAALKTAIQAHFQLEDRELATEQLPSSDTRRYILLYEAAEGGAGVLRRLVEDAQAVPAIARVALDIAHFNPETGEDLHRPAGAREDCEAACYDCLLSYYNQRDHRLLDRKLLPNMLRSWKQATVRVSPAPVGREDHVTRLMNLCQSELERDWVRLVDRMGLKLPSDAQRVVQNCGVRPDFLYREEGAAIFIDGPPHDTPHQRMKDDEQRDTLEDHGLTVIRFHHRADWQQIIERYPTLFGTPVDSYEVMATPTVDAGFDAEDFDIDWRETMKALSSTDGVSVEPGDEVMEDGRVIDLDLATVSKDGTTVRVVDDGRSTADAVAQALAGQGHRVLHAHAEEPNLLDRILAALAE